METFLDLVDYGLTAMPWWMEIIICGAAFFLALIIAPTFLNSQGLDGMDSDAARAGVLNFGMLAALLALFAIRTI